MKRLCIPDWAKAEGIIWVEYPLCEVTLIRNILELFEVDAIVELKIQQERN